MTTSHDRRWLILTLLSAAMLPIALDATILYIAVPSLSAGLAPSARQLLWIMDVYSLLLAGLVIATGPIGDRVGHRRMLLIGLGIFGLASVVAAFAPSAGFLIAARGLLAFGGAMIVPATLSIIRNVFRDEKERAIAIGVWGGIASGGTALGPIIGGVLLEHFWWGAVFLVNLPVVLLLLPALKFNLAVDNVARLPEQSWRRLSFTLIGILGIIAVAYALKALATVPDGVDIAIGFAGLILLLGFAQRQLRAADPLIDFRLFQSPPFLVGALTALLPFLALAGFEFVLAQELQMVRGLSPLDAGLFLLPMPLAMIVMAPLGGRLVGAFGMRLVLVAALLVGGVGYLLLGCFGLIADPVLGRLLLAVIGGGHGIAMMSASDAIMSAAPPERAGGAAAIESIAFEFGTGFGIAILGSFTTYVFLRNLAPLVPGDLTFGSVSEALFVAERMSVSAGPVLVEAIKETFTLAFETCAIAAGIVMLGSAVLFAWLLRRKA